MKTFESHRGPLSREAAGAAVFKFPFWYDLVVFLG